MVTKICDLLNSKNFKLVLKFVFISSLGSNNSLFPSNKLINKASYWN